MPPPASVNKRSSTVGSADQADKRRIQQDNLNGELEFQFEEDEETHPEVTMTNNNDNDDDGNKEEETNDDDDDDDDVHQVVRSRSRLSSPAAHTRSKLRQQQQQQQQQTQSPQRRLLRRSQVATQNEADESAPQTNNEAEIQAQKWKQQQQQQQVRHNLDLLASKKRKERVWKRQRSLDLQLSAAAPQRTSSLLGEKNNGRADDDVSDHEESGNDDDSDRADNLPSNKRRKLRSSARRSLNREFEWGVNEHSDDEKARYDTSSDEDWMVKDLEEGYHSSEDEIVDNDQDNNDEDDEKNNINEKNRKISHKRPLSPTPANLALIHREIFPDNDGDSNERADVPRPGVEIPSPFRSRGGPKSRFQTFVQYLVKCNIDPSFAAVVRDNPGSRENAQYFYALNFIRDKTLAVTNNFIQSSVWPAQVRTSLDSLPILQERVNIESDQECQACRRRHAASACVRLSGHPYSSGQLWEIFAFEPRPLSRDQHDILTQHQHTDDDDDDDDRAVHRQKHRKRHKVDLQAPTRVEFLVGPNCLKRMTLYHHVCHFKYRVVDCIQARIERVKHKLFDQLSRDPSPAELERAVLGGTKLADKLFGIWMVLTERGATTNTNNFDLTANFDDILMLVDFSSSDDGNSDQSEDSDNDEDEIPQRTRRAGTATTRGGAGDDRQTVLLLQQEFEALEKEHEDDNESQKHPPLKQGVRQVPPRFNPLTADTDTAKPAVDFRTTSSPKWRRRPPQVQQEGPLVIEIEDDLLAEKELLETPILPPPSHTGNIREKTVVAITESPLPEDKPIQDNPRTDVM